MSKPIIELLRERAVVGRMEVRDKQLMLEAADQLESNCCDRNEGRWIERFSNSIWYYDCPFCDDGYAMQVQDTSTPQYCSNCGAILCGTTMKGE